MAGDPVDFVLHFREQYGFIKAIFIDEIQHIQEAGLFVKALVDARLDVPIFVTGSSSFHLRSKTRESLAGRATRRKLLPPLMVSTAHPTGCHETTSFPEQSLISLINTLKFISPSWLFLGNSASLGSYDSS
jgi:hypothetical protein